MARQRLTRAEQQAQTRAQVLRAAATVFARRGFDGASMSEVAVEAGFTKGAIYSNFASKDELFAAVLEDRCRSSLDETRRLLQSADAVSGRLSEFGEELAQRFLGDRDWTRLLMEFWARSMRDAKLRRRFAAIWREMRDGLATAIEHSPLAADGHLPMPPDQLAAAAMAVVDGLALQMLIDPPAITPATFGTSLALLAAAPAEAVQEGVRR